MQEKRFYAKDEDNVRQVILQRDTGQLFHSTQVKSSLSLANRRAQGLMNFVPSSAYHFCLALPAAFTQTWDRFFAETCTVYDRV